MLLPPSVVHHMKIQREEDHLKTTRQEHRGLRSAGTLIWDFQVSRTGRNNCLSHSVVIVRAAQTKIVPKIFTGGWLYRLPLPNTFQNSKLPEEGQVLYTLGTVNLINWRHGGNTQEICFQMPANGQSCKQVFLLHCHPVNIQWIPMVHTAK